MKINISKDEKKRYLPVNVPDDDTWAVNVNGWAETTLITPRIEIRPLESTGGV
jgi:hypothetical protein